MTTQLNTHQDNHFSIKHEIKTEPSVDLQDCFDLFERVIEQVPTFDQYLINNIDSYDSNDFSIGEPYQSLLLSPSTSSLSSNTSSSVASIVPATIAHATETGVSLSSSSSSSSVPLFIRSHSLSSPSTSSLSPPTHSSECFDLKKDDTISSYLTNIDVDDNSRYFRSFLTCIKRFKFTFKFAYEK